MSEQKFIEISKSFFVDEEFKAAFEGLGLSSIEAVFSFDAGENLAKENLAAYRSRMQFQIDSPATTLFLKRYNHPSMAVQIKNWIAGKKKSSLAISEIEPAARLSQAGINTPKTIGYGQKWGLFFEEQSFSITEKIADAESLEKKLPDCFLGQPTKENLQRREDFIAKLAGFIKKFHDTGFRHRDLYLCHIFVNKNQEFFLIDLARAFKPRFLADRYRVKDLAQLYYSSPGKYFTRTDRLLFYFNYLGRKQLTKKDKLFIAKVKRKAQKMARHDIKHGRSVPFTS